MSLRAVLDTNVWLDWLVFKDAGVEPLRAAQQAGSLDVVRTLTGERELERVLGHETLKPLVGAGLGPIVLEGMRAVSRLHDGSTRPGCLPACRDADDQTFLELARDCSADVLVTKDRDLLVLRRSKFRASAGGLTFRIVTPPECAGLLDV